MTLHYLPRSGYTARPWKNGQGTTHDITLWPEGAGHADFDLRIALSPIPGPGTFSSFPGIDRVITLVKGQELTLDFDTHSDRLTQGQSLPFDSALAPLGTPTPGGVEVINIMARRGDWQIASCAVTEARTHRVPGSAHLVLLPIDGAATVATDTETRILGPLDTALCAGPGDVRITATGGVLAALIEPATG